MMHTTYTSSNSIISIRTYSAFNNDYSYYSNERCPSNYCSCCCSFPINSCKLILPTNPSYLFGLRQSTLIQCPPSRRFVLGSSDRVFGRLSNYYDVGRCGCSESCCVKQERVDRIIRTNCNCKEKCCVSKEKGIDLNKIKSRMGRPKRDFRSNALGDVEAMLSLLSEGNVEDCGVVREKNRSSFKEGNFGSKQDAAIEKLKDRKPNVGSTYRESEPKNHQLDLGRVPRLPTRKPNVGSGYRESELKNRQPELGRVLTREEGRKRGEERKNLFKDEDPRLRGRESSSSYYSFSDSGDFESDLEVELKEEQSFGESSSSFKKDSSKSGGAVNSKESDQDWKKRRDEKEQVLRSSTHDDSRVSGSIQRDWRKKSEKKLTDESEETKSRNDSVAKKSQFSQAQESSSMIASSSKKQLNYHEEQSISDMKSLGQSSSHIIKDNRASRYSKSSNQHEHLLQINREDVETTSSAWRRSSLGEDSNIVGKSVQKTGCDYCETCGRSMEENKTQSDVQRYADRSETSIDAKLAISGESLSESSRHRKHKKSSSSLQSSVDEESRQDDQIHTVTGQASANRKSQHYRESISADDSSTQSTSREAHQSEAGMHKLVDKSRTNTESQPGRSRRKEEKSSISLQTSVKEENKKHDKIYRRTGQAFDARRKTQHFSEVMDTDASYLQSTSKAQQSETRKKHLEEKKTSLVAAEEAKRSLQTSVKEENKKHDEIYQRTGQAFDARRKSQHYSEVINTDASYLQSTLNAQQQSETRKKHLEEKKTSLVAAEEAKRLRDDSGRLMTKDIESRKVSHTDIGDSRVHSSTLEINSQSASDKRVYKEQTSSKLKLKSVEESVEKRKWIDETIVQSRTEVQGPSTGHFSGTATISKPSVPSISHTEVQQFSGEEVKSGQLSVTSPPYQHASRLSQFPEASSGPVRNDMGRTTKVGSDSMQKFSLASSPSSYGEGVDSGSKSGEKYFPEDALVSAARMQDSSSLIVGEFVEKMSNEPSPSDTSIEQKLSNVDSKNYTLKGSTQSGSEDALVSAAYMQESSSRIVGEFVEKISHEASASDTNIEKKLTKVNIKHQDKNYMLKGSTQSDSDKTGLQKHDLEHSSGIHSPDSEKNKSLKLDSSSSGDSGTKGSSDQMWDVKDHFVQEATEIEPLEGATSESVNSKRTGKSLWNVVSGVLRLRWGSHTEKQKSPVKGQSSPSRSATGETWFSENEADEANDDGMKAENIGLLQETSSDQPRLGTTRSQKKDVVVVSLDKQSSHVDMGASSSSSVLQSSSLSGGAIVGENANLNITEHLSKPSPSVDLSTPGKLRRSLAFEEDDGAEKIEAPTSSSDEQREISVDVRQTGASASKGAEVELKRKKLQRSKVVLQRFDDWEDAYRRDREQRKVDEIFMREALAEAIKAADSWEVPVGAVLVHNGNIIARGYNLVEELRDSTAHAEMLCIKEGSNVLRTWRLSETTLYVTLEPCPMCAGAIMQARISTLVWGAPNKLLGADGSWIRLFPEAMEGKQRAEVTDKPAAPAHPFHPNMKIRRGILEEECGDIMQQFFQLRRRKVKEKKAETSSEESESVQPTCFPKPHHRSKLLHKMHNVFHPSKQSSD